MAMIKLPQHFDKNEWFILITILLLIMGYLIAPKILPRQMTLTVLVFFAALGLTSDVLIGADYPADFYVIMDSPKLELFDLLVYALNYPLYGYFFSYAICKWRMRAAQIAWFVPLWCLLSAGIEWLAVHFKIYTYQNGWNLGFSTAFYLLTFTFCAIATKRFIRLWRPRREDGSDA